MKPETIVAYVSRDLDRISGIAPETKALVLRAAQQKAQERELSGDDKDASSQSLLVQVICAEIIEDHWNELPEEQRLLLCFPAAPQIGDSVDIPKRGKGTVLWRKLTERLGLEVCFRMKDGSMFKWEFWD